MTESAANPIKAVQHSLEIIEVLEGHPMRLSEIAEVVDVETGTVHKHLATLLEAGYVNKYREHYHLDWRFLEIGGFERYRHPIFRTVQSPVQQLARETGEIANVMIEHEGQGIMWLHEREPDSVHIDMHMGETSPLNASAYGKAILSVLDEERVAEIIDRQGLPALTDDTITDEDALLDALHRVRERGYAIDDGEYQTGVRSVAAPWRKDDGTFAGAIGLSVPERRVLLDDLHEDLAPKVMSKANIIELELRSNIQASSEPS
jgi:IclR family acetate operon transcriptional repressor